ncbi:hypothetical protein [Streptomyces sp. NPDC090025]|uniref:hypothetical protein n=1 Tax=Streptomyces sp. NPDC090025 TaxID=3365922 RepID=UPI003837B7C6
MKSTDQVRERLVLRHTLRVTAPIGPEGQGGAVARQLDVALMSVGFKLSAGLLAALSGRAPDAVATTAAGILGTVRELVGDHVRHNVYFKDFPAAVPDTQDFWTACVAQALSADEETRERTLAQLAAGRVDLLTLPDYGRYRHGYDDMAAAHDELVTAAGDRVTVLHPGGPVEAETTALYLALAGAVTPLGDAHRADLAVLAELCAEGPQPEEIPVREHRALVNRARLRAGQGLFVDTVTDVLRLACALSGGDVTLLEPTRFRSPSRPHRRALLAALDAVVAADPAKLTDVARHREAWKRLGERLHPHEHPGSPHAAQVFAVARGELRAPSLAARSEALLARGEVAGAAEFLAATAPGLLFRALDRLLRLAAADDTARETVLAAAERTAPQVAGRVLLAVREHLLNRAVGTRTGTGTGEAPGAVGRGAGTPGKDRVFVNRYGGAWVAEDTRPPLPPDAHARLVALLDAETGRRLDAPEHLLVDPALLDVALPLSGRAVAGGFGTLPRGSRSPADGEFLRFFMYWKQTERSTDYDLSGLLLDADYETVDWLSYTALTSVEGVHSGDITDAKDGASEFIELRLGAVRGDFVVPQVHIYAGEGFDRVAESFFGFMLRGADQRGLPFEPRTVRMKSDLRGTGRIALPLAFQREADGRWTARWIHLYLKGEPSGNRVEDNRGTLARLVGGIVERTPLTVRHVTGLLAAAGTRVTWWDGASALPAAPVTYLGMARPEGLAPGSRAITPENLRDLIPA